MTKTTTNAMSSLHRDLQKEAIAKILNPYAWLAPEAFEGKRQQSYEEQRKVARNAAEAAVGAFYDVEPAPVQRYSLEFISVQIKETE